MVINEYVKCNSCGTLINLRAQASGSPSPFSIDCPVCSSNISGIMDEQEEQTDKYFGLIDITNAKVVNPPETSDSFYSFELSTEFLTRKVIKKDNTSFELTPFIRNAFTPLTTTNAIQNAYIFYNYIADHKWERLMNLIELNINGNQKYIIDPLNNILKESNSALKKVNSPLEITVALHQILLTDSGLAFSFGVSELGDYIKHAKILVDRKKEIKNYVINNLATITIQLKDFNQGFIKLISEFASLYQQFIPVIAFRSYNNIDELDLDKLGITTLNYEQINSFYSHSYEFILKNLDIIFVLNNLFSRGDASKYPHGKSLEQFNKISAYNKISEMISSEPFSRPLKSLKNKIRNAITHYDVSLDRNKQLITYQDRKKSQQLYYVELANLCLENVSLSFYLNELFYTLEKFQSNINNVPFNPELKGIFTDKA
ncbi:hypothetical protein [Levilactobacillus brevis]